MSGQDIIIEDLVLRACLFLLLIAIFLIMGFRYVFVHYIDAGGLLGGLVENMTQP